MWFEYGTGGGNLAGRSKLVINHESNSGQWWNMPKRVFWHHHILHQQLSLQMLPLETKLSGGKLLPQSDLWRGVFLEEMSYRRYDKKECKEQKAHHSYKIGTWNIRTLNQVGKLENLKMEMQKNDVSVLGVSEVRWKG